MSKKLYVCLSLDVEEEGLFSGKYASRNLGLANISRLRKLAPISQELGFPLTLYCAHSVFVNAQACGHLAWMRERCGAEIGGHLHHWSTPPLSDDAPGAPLRTHLLPPPLLRQRLLNLLEAGRNFLGAPLTSFRMGRWDLKTRLLPMLADFGILVDSSICPLRAFANGPDHFLAPAEPYWVATGSDRMILEAPVTQIAILPGLARLWRKIAPARLLDSFHFFGALSANPLWHGAGINRLAARLHSLRGGQVLNFFLHSSELMPGGSPHVPDEAAATALLKRLLTFCRWLGKNFDAQGVRASELATIIPRDRRQPSGLGDWGAACQTAPENLKHIEKNNQI